MKSFSLLVIFAVISLSNQALESSSPSLSGSGSPSPSGGPSSGQSSPSSGQSSPSSGQSSPSSGSGCGDTGDAGGSSGSSGCGMIPDTGNDNLMAGGSSMYNNENEDTDNPMMKANASCDSIIKYYDIEVIKEAVTWNVANTSCTDKGKRLLKIDFVRKFECIKETQTEDDYWIGLTYDSKKKVYVWTTGDSPKNNVTFWKEDEPNLTGNCIYLWGTADFEWDDTYCSKTKYYICEKSK